MLLREKTLQVLITRKGFFLFNFILYEMMDYYDNHFMMYVSQIIV